MTKVDWDDFKSFVAIRDVPVHEIRTQGRFLHIAAFDGPMSMSCKLTISSDPDSEYLDYVDNFKSSAVQSMTDSTGVLLSRNRAFANADNMRFRGHGVSQVVTGGQTTNIDHLVSESRFLNGMEIMAKNHVFGDSTKFQVVDVDNVIGYGPGVVLDEFGTDWHLAEDSQRQGPYILPYPALVSAGLYLRLVYTSLGSSDVHVLANYFLHKKTS